MSPVARLAGQALELARVSRRAARAHGASALGAARRARLVRRRQGYEYAEALREGLLDPALPDDVRVRHTSRHATLEAQRRLNSEAVAPLTGEKAIFYRYAEMIGLPVPALYGVIDTRGSGWSRRGRVIADANAFTAFIEQDVPDELVVKPSDGYHGRGVRLLWREGGALVGARGERLSPARLLDELRADPEFSVWVIQERLRNHPALTALVDVPTLHTLRLVTLVDRAGNVEELYATLRLALTGGDTDNFRSGRSGNGLVNVDLETGELGMLKLPRPDGCGFVETPEVPGTGVRVQGARLPDWDRTRRLCVEAALSFLPLRTLGWDVALTPRGPVIGEANAFWWPRSSPDQGRLLARMNAVA